MRTSFPPPRRLPVPPAFPAAAAAAAAPAEVSRALPRALPMGHGMIHAPGSPLENTLRLAAAASRRECPVFLRGESGSGKEMLAQFLHAGGPRAPGPFVAVNCAAL